MPGTTLAGARLVWDGEVILYSALLDRQPPLDHLLSPDELIRAGRFKFEIHRRRFVAGRGVLRTLLAKRVGEDPGSLDLIDSEFGKPGLAAHPAVAFNVSHSGDLALFAFTSGADIGVDVEHLRPLDPIDMSHGYFSEGECRELASLPEARRLTAFFDGWVRKEAVIKADGRGMSMPLDSFSVRLAGLPRLYVLPPEPPGVDWELHPVDVGSTARAAVALRRTSISSAVKHPSLRAG